MTRYWVTTGSPNPEAVVNPLAAACTEWNYIPDRIALLANPGLERELDRIVDLAKTVVEAHSGETPAIQLTDIDTETDFEAIVDHYRTTITEARDTNSEVVVDVTPGRKFMSAIAFQAGIRYEADRVCYLLVQSGELFGRIYADLPRSATTLYDFSEVFA